MKAHVIPGAYGRSQQEYMALIPAKPNRAARRAIQKQQAPKEKKRG